MQFKAMCLHVYLLTLKKNRLPKNEKVHSARLTEACQHTRKNRLRPIRLLESGSKLSTRSLHAVYCVHNPL